MTSVHAKKQKHSVILQSLYRGHKQLCFNFLNPFSTICLENLKAFCVQDLLPSKTVQFIVHPPTLTALSLQSSLSILAQLLTLIQQRNFSVHSAMPTMGGSLSNSAPNKIFIYLFSLFIGTYICDLFETRQVTVIVLCISVRPCSELPWATKAKFAIDPETLNGFNVKTIFSF